MASLRRLRADQTVRCALGVCEKLFDLYAQVQWTERFRHERICPTFGCSVGHLRLSVRGEYENLEVGGFGVVPQPPEDLPTVEARKADVEDDRIWPFLLNRFEPRRSVIGRPDVDTEHPKTHFDQPSDRSRVLDDEYVLFHIGVIGRMIRRLHRFLLHPHLTDVDCAFG